jgi:hypothetical protein
MNSFKERDIDDLLEETRRIKALSLDYIDEKDREWLREEMVKDAVYGYYYHEEDLPNLSERYKESRQELHRGWQELYYEISPYADDDFIDAEREKVHKADESLGREYEALFRARERIYAEFTQYEREKQELSRNTQHEEETSHTRSRER